MIARITLLSLALLLAGCDNVEKLLADPKVAQREADAKAIGGACRHAGRALEDCFALNRKADKAAVFAGWREMNDYMRENKIEAVAPHVGAATEIAGKAARAETAEPRGDAAPDPAKPSAHGS